MLAPVKIVINSDGNELAFNGNSGKTYFYKYTKSVTKLGQELQLQEAQLKALLSVNNIIVKQAEEAPIPAVKKQELHWLPPVNSAEQKPTVIAKAKTKANQQSLF